MTKLGANISELEDRRREFMKKSPRILDYKADLIKRIEYSLDGELATVHIPWDDIKEYSDEYKKLAQETVLLEAFCSNSLLSEGTKIIRTIWKIKMAAVIIEDIIKLLSFVKFRLLLNTMKMMNMMMMVMMKIKIKLSLKLKRKNLSSILMLSNYKNNHILI